MPHSNHIDPCSCPQGAGNRDAGRFRNGAESCRMTESATKEAQKARVGKVLPRAAREGVQAMQLKLFIETSVLQKRGKTQIQSGGQRGL